MTESTRPRCINARNSDWDQIKALAAQAKMSVSQYVVFCALGTKVTYKHTKKAS